LVLWYVVIPRHKIKQYFASGAENILRGGGDINDIAKLYGIDNNARKNLAFENDKLADATALSFHLSK